MSVQDVDRSTDSVNQVNTVAKDHEGLSQNDSGSLKKSTDLMASSVANGVSDTVNGQPQEIELQAKDSSAKMSAADDNATWRPHEGHYLQELPPKYQQMLEPYFRKWIDLRWRVLHIFNMRIPINIPFAPIGFTIGELLIVAILLIAPAVTMAVSWTDVASLGSNAAIVLMFSLFFIPRMSIAPLLLGLSYERALFWHKFFVFIAVIMSLVHGLSYYNDQEWDLNAAYNDSDDMDKARTGTAMFAAMVLMSTLSFWPIRRYFFQIWKILHILFFIAVIVTALLHGASAVIAGLAFWILDNMYRFFFRIPRMYKNTEDTRITQMPGDITRISFKTDALNYHPGQFAFICVPSVARLEWHPISFSSAPGGEYTTFHIKASGDWSKKLYKFAGKCSDEENVRVYIDGPYGEPMIDIDGDKYEHILLVAGGIGITPMYSTLKGLQNQYSRGRPLSKVNLTWVARDMNVVSAVTDDLQKEISRASSEITPELPFAATESKLDKDDGALPRIPSTATATKLTKLGKEGELTENAPSESVSEVKDNDDDKTSVEVEMKPMSNVFEANIYVTRGGGDDVAQFTSGALNSATTKMHTGRPNLKDTIFPEMASTVNTSGKRVAVMVCGPQCLVDDVRRACFSQSRRLGTPFDFHAEIFEF